MNPNLHHRHANAPAEPRWPRRLRRLLPRSRRRGWATVLANLQAAGNLHGSCAAAWWQQETIGGRATGAVKATAARVLAGLHNLDPAILDTLPTLAVDDQLHAHIYTEHAGRAAPRWQRLHPCERVQALDAYQDAYETALHQQVETYCRQLLDTDLDTDPAAGHTRSGGSSPRAGEPR